MFVDSLSHSLAGVKRAVSGRLAGWLADAPPTFALVGGGGAIVFYISAIFVLAPDAARSLLSIFAPSEAEA